MQTLLTLCEETYTLLRKKPSSAPISEQIQKDISLKKYIGWIEEHLHDAWEVYKPQGVIPATAGIPLDQGDPRLRGDDKIEKSLKAITWNIERGKQFDPLLKILQTHPEIKDADFYFLTEVDWGMARSQNRNVVGELGQELGYYAYFSPSYFNFTKGHGAERNLPGENRYGLHGKAILSKYPLKNIRPIKMSNTFDKLNSIEARLGEKRALLGDFEHEGTKLTLACTHLDVFSSPQLRSDQLKKAVDASRKNHFALIAGDWNTNTLNFISNKTILSSVLKQIFLNGPQKMIRNHYPYPERKFDKFTFEMLKSCGFDYEGCNELGVGTFDLLSTDQEVGLMGKDQFPEWIVKWIGKQIKKSGGSLSFKLDWFASKNLEGLERKVIKLQRGVDYLHLRPSDHHPVLFKFSIPAPVTAYRLTQNSVQPHVKSSSESAPLAVQEKNKSIPSSS